MTPVPTHCNAVAWRQMLPLHDGGEMCIPNLSATTVDHAYVRRKNASPHLTDTQRLTANAVGAAVDQACHSLSNLPSFARSIHHSANSSISLLPSKVYHSVEAWGNCSHQCFLFTQTSPVEKLSPILLLSSFIARRKGEGKSSSLPAYHRWL